jgi:archaellum component FlaF (FlaF/FlaG flagellin family)
MSLYVSKELEGNLNISDLGKSIDNQIKIMNNGELIKCDLTLFKNNKKRIIIELHTYNTFNDVIFGNKKFNIIYNGKHIKDISLKNIKSIQRNKDKYIIKIKIMHEVNSD